MICTHDVLFVVVCCVLLFAIAGRTADTRPFGYKARVACSRSSQAALLLLPFVVRIQASWMPESSISVVQDGALIELRECTNQQVPGICPTAVTTWAVKKDVAFFNDEKLLLSRLLQFLLLPRSR